MNINIFYKRLDKDQEEIIECTKYKDIEDLDYLEAGIVIKYEGDYVFWPFGSFLYYRRTAK